ncbi:MAG TPA: hypothetical protein VNF03_12700 [Patescibacteria group bacterium]|nr:hypothetical protein [Patescibacteria group bacterium]
MTSTDLALSATVYVAAPSLITPGTSLSMIVSVAVRWASSWAGALGSLSVSSTVSAPSARMSGRTGTMKVAVRLFAANVTTPCTVV